MDEQKLKGKGTQTHGDEKMANTPYEEVSEKAIMKCFHLVRPISSKTIEKFLFSSCNGDDKHCSNVDDSSLDPSNMVDVDAVYLDQPSHDYNDLTYMDIDMDMDLDIDMNLDNSGNDNYDGDHNPKTGDGGHETDHGKNQNEDEKGKQPHPPSTAFFSISKLILMSFGLFLCAYLKGLPWDPNYLGLLNLQLDWNLWIPSFTKQFIHDERSCVIARIQVSHLFII